MWIVISLLLTKHGLLLINTFVLIMQSHTRGVTVCQLAGILCDIRRLEITKLVRRTSGSLSCSESFQQFPHHREFPSRSLTNVWAVELILTLFLCFLFSFLYRNQSPNPGHPSQRQPGRVTTLGCPWQLSWLQRSPSLFLLSDVLSTSKPQVRVPLRADAGFHCLRDTF